MATRLRDDDNLSECGVNGVSRLSTRFQFNQRPGPSSTMITPPEPCSARTDGIFKSSPRNVCRSKLKSFSSIGQAEMMRVSAGRLFVKSSLPQSEGRRRHLVKGVVTSPTAGTMVATLCMLIVASIALAGLQAEGWVPAANRNGQKVSVFTAAAIQPISPADDPEVENDRHDASGREPARLAQRVGLRGHGGGEKDGDSFLEATETDGNAAGSQEAFRFPSSPPVTMGIVGKLVKSFFKKIEFEGKRNPPTPSSSAVVEELGGPKTSFQGDVGGFGEVRQSVVACTITTQAVVVVDAGSTKTRANLLSYETEWCPGKGRRPFLNTLTHWGEGPKLDGMRQSIHSFISKYIGDDYDATAEQDATLASYTGELRSEAAQIVHGLLESVEKMMKEKLTGEAIEDAKISGVPVFYHSTGGVRDLPGRLREVFFVALQDEILNYLGKAGILFYTSPELAKPIGGTDEGAYTWLTANHYLGRLEKLRRSGNQLEPYATRHTEVAKEYDNLVAIVEVGGASTQFVFPVNPNQINPSFVKSTDMQKHGYLPYHYPKVTLLSVSFMQHGLSSSMGLILKGFCEDPRNLQDGVCSFPCFNPGFTQRCSADVISVENGKITLTGRSQLAPVASYCDGRADEIRLKGTNQLECHAARLDTEKPYKERIAIHGCETIRGTGNFDECRKVVDQFVINRSLPFPANAEATGSGFDNPRQIFEFVPTDSTVLVTGTGLVEPIKLLQSKGMLPKEFRGELDALVTAASKACQVPIVTAETAAGKNVGPSGMAFAFDDSLVPMTKFNYAMCRDLAYSAEIISALKAGKSHPNTVLFSDDLEVATASKTKRPSLGWASGVVFSSVANGSLKLIMEGGPPHKIAYRRSRARALG